MIGKTNAVIDNNLGTLVWNGSAEFILAYDMNYEGGNVLTWHSDTLLTDVSITGDETFTIKMGATIDAPKRKFVCLPTIDAPITGYTAWECTDEVATETVDGLIVKYYVLIDSNNNLSLYAKMNAIKAIWRGTFTALYKK